MDRATVVARAARDLRARSPFPPAAPAGSSHPIEGLCARLALTVTPAPQDGAMLGGAHARLQLWLWGRPEVGGVVWVRDDLSAELRAFAIAHELGHLALHRGEGATFHSTCAPSLVNEQADADELRRDVTGVEEYTPRARRELEANAFAAELLAPAVEVRALFAASPACDVDTVAQVFGVSATLARQRLLAAVLSRPDASEPAHSGSMETPNAGRNPQELLDRLDASQRKAARSTGPALIVAGPGTGKTATLVGRVAHLILERGRQPEQVLALTFSNRAAGEMRQRLAESGLPGERMPVLTIHAFATTLLREYAGRAPHALDEPPLAADFRIQDEIDGFLLAEDLLAEFPLRYYRSFGNPTAHLAELLQDFARARDALWTPAMYLARATEMPSGVHDESVVGEVAEDERMDSNGADGRTVRMGASTVAGQRARACERARAYAVWDRALRRAGLLDFGGLIQRAVELLAADEHVLHDVRARYRDVLVDEFQDTNRAAAELLFLLAGADGRGLWVVGDHRQAIYRWRGAAPSNMYRLGERYPDLRVHTLGVSYRSTPALLDLGHAMASMMATPRADGPSAEIGGRAAAIDAAAAGQRLTAKRAPTAHAPVLYAPEFATADEECAGVVAAIQAQRDVGYTYADQAILCRSHRQVRRVTAALSAAGVPAVQVGGFFDRPEIKDGLALLGLAAGPDARGLLRAPRLLESLGYPMPNTTDWTRAALHVFAATTPSPACLVAADQHNGATGTLSAGAARALDAIGALGRIATDMRYRTSVAESLSRFFLRPGGYAWRLLRRADAADETGARNLDRGNAASALTALGELIRIAARFDLRWNTDQAFRERLSRSVRHGRHAERSGDATADEAEPPAPTVIKAGQVASDALPVVCFLRYFDALRATGADIVLPAGADDAVRVMTIHASKGLEFPVVYLPALAKGQFPPTSPRADAPPPGLREDTSPAQRLAEEQCLFYVGVTRARDVVAISRAASYTDSGTPAKPSELLALVQDAAPFQAAQPFPGVPALAAEPRATATDDKRLADETEKSDAAARDGQPVTTKRRFTYAELDQYIRCPRKYKYMSVLGLWDSSENAMLRFHRYLRHGARILRQRATTAPVPDWTALATELRAEWEAIGPVGHAYEAFYHRNALVMLQREWAELTASGGAPIEADVAAPLEAELRDCVVEVAADRIVYGTEVRDKAACRPITLVRQRTGTPAKTHQDDLRLPLFAIACRQRGPDAQARIELRYRGDVLREPGDEPDDEPAAATAYTVDMTAKARKQADVYLRPARKGRSALDTLDEAAAGIGAGRFPPLPDEHKCARCSFHSICPADLALTD